MSSKKSDVEIWAIEFELDTKKLPAGTKVKTAGRSSNDGKPLISHLTIEFETSDPKVLDKFPKMKYFAGVENDDYDKYLWFVSFVRNY